MPCTISLIRRGSTPIDTASLFCVIPKPSMKSSMRTSPGWIGAILSAVVNDLHLLRSGVRPYEPDPPDRSIDRTLLVFIPTAALIMAIFALTAQVITTSLGYTGPIWVGAAFAALAFIVLLATLKSPKAHRIAETQPAEPEMLPAGG